MFGRQREFLGYRGFGVLGEEIEAVAVPEASEPAPLRPTSALEAGVHLSESAAGPLESLSNLRQQRAPMRLRMSATRTDASPSRRPPGCSNRKPRCRRARLELRSRHPERPASRSKRTLSTPRPPRLRAKRTTFSPLRRLTEASDSDAPVAEAEQPNLTERSMAGEPASSPPERTAAIYVLRHPAPALSSNIVPIRPGALDALARETAPSFPAESVELSRSERDAFREIARALVGRAPASRDEPSDERTAADNRREVGVEARAEQPTDRPGRCCGFPRRRRR